MRNKRDIRIYNVAGKLISVFIIVLLFSFCYPVYAYEFPHSFWAMNDNYMAAVNSQNNSNIIKYGNQIIDLMSSQPDSQEKRNVLVSRYNEVGRAYAATGDYENAAKIFKTFYDYIAPLGSEYYDYKKSAKARYEQYTTRMDIYTDNGASPYYGAKNEKRNGILFGLCSTSEIRKNLDNESMTIIYQELGQSLLSYNKNKMKEANASGIAVEFALNCPNYAADIRNYKQFDSYLSEISDLFETYSSTPVYLRFAAEFDIWTTPPEADDFVDAFRYVSNYFKSRNSNVAIVWSPNQISSWYINLDDYYPGDSYVDWVGMSSYAQKYFEGDKNADEVNEIVFKSGANSTPVAAVKDIVEKYGDRKPIMISEMGCSHTIVKTGENTSDFALDRLRQYYTYLPMVYPQIKLIAYFDQYVSGGTETSDYRLSENAAMRNEYIKLTKGARFIQDAYDNDSPMCYRKAENGMSLGNTFLAACYAHKYNTNTQKVTYFIDDTYAGMSEEYPFSTYVSANGYTGKHRLKAVAEFSDGSTKALEKEVNFQSAGKDITVEISGSSVGFDQQPVIYNDRTMVPMRKIFEELNANVSWDNETKTATGTRGDRTVKISVGSSNMSVNNKQIMLDTSPIILGDRTLVPVRAVAEGLGCTVDWDGNRYLVSITPKIFKWSDWDTYLPNDVDDDLYYIEERSEYRRRTRTREKETFELDYMYSSGNYVRTDTSYGKWSGWTRDYIRGTDNLDVETKTVSEPTRYKYYHYCTGYNDDINLRYQTANYDFDSIASYHELGTFDDQLPYAPDGNGGHVLYNEDGSIYKCSNTCFRWYEESQGGSHTEYRSRPIYYSYVYWQWGDWSNWSSWSEWKEGSGDLTWGDMDNSRDVDTETRTLYRYKEK